MHEKRQRPRLDFAAPHAQPAGSTRCLFVLGPTIALWVLGGFASPSFPAQDSRGTVGAAAETRSDRPPRSHRQAQAAWRLAADFDAPTHVFVVFNPDWPGLMEGLVRQVTPTARVVFLRFVEDSASAAEKFVGELPPHLRRRVDLLPLQVNSSWIRDYGPRVLQRGDALRWVDAHYDDERPLDDDSPAELGRVLRVPVFPSSLDLDGGGVVSNGRGLCLMTEHSWAQLGAMPSSGGFVADGSGFGCDEVLILPSLAHEATGHADVFAQFVSADHLLLAQVDPDESASDARRLERAHRRLVSWAESRRTTLTITRINMPVLDGQVYYSYINGLQLADRYLAPRFRDIPKIREAAIHAQLAVAFSGRSVATLAANVLQELGGVLHCATLGVRIPATLPTLSRVFGQARTRDAASHPSRYEANHPSDL